MMAPVFCLSSISLFFLLFENTTKVGLSSFFLVGIYGAGYCQCCLIWNLSEEQCIPPNDLMSQLKILAGEVNIFNSIFFVKQLKGITNQCVQTK